MPFKLSLKPLVLFIVFCVTISALFVGNTVSSFASTGWSTNTNPVASGSLACSTSPASVASARTGETLTLVGTGSSPCSLNLYRSSDGLNTFSSPQVLATATQIRDQSLTVLNNGTIFALWQENTGVGNATILRQSHSSDNGVTWSSPNTISTAGNFSYNARFPAVAPYGAQGVALSWTQFDGTNERIMTRFSLNLAQWTQSQAVSPSGTNGVTSVIATNDQNAIAIAWQTIDGNGKLTVSVASSTNWNSTRLVVTTNPLTSSPSQQLTTLSNGSFALTYFDATNAGASTHQVFTRTSSDAGATWSSALAISGNLNSQINGLSVTKTQNNSIVAAWGAGTTSWAIIQSAQGNATNTTWSSPTTVMPQGSLPYALGKIAANTDGSVMMIFRLVGVTPPDSIFTSISSNNGSTWSTPSQLATYVRGFPAQSLTITPLVATGYGVSWNQEGSPSFTQFVRSYDWSAPVNPPAPAPTPYLPATGFSHLGWLLFVGGLLIAVGAVSLRLTQKKI